MSTPALSAERIHALHTWYETNVMKLRLTPEVERLWFEFFKAGHNGHELARVVRYLRRCISRGKRNDGCLSLSSMLRPDESGVLRFSIDLGLSGANYQVDQKLSKLPAGEMTEPPPPAPSRLPAGPQPSQRPAPTPEEIASRNAALKALKEDIR